MEILQQLFAVALVLGALCAAVWALKRKGWARMGPMKPRGGAQPRLEVLDRLVLTPNHSLHLVRMEDRTLLVGLSPNGCNLLETGTPTLPGVNR